MPAYPIDHARILVGSMAESTAYYTALLPLLGFAQVGEGAWRNDSGFLIQLGEAEPGTRPYDRYGAGLNHLGFAVPDLADVQAVADGMAAAGFDPPALQDFGDAVALFMADPDGLRFEVTCYAN